MTGNKDLHKIVESFLNSATVGLTRRWKMSAHITDRYFKIDFI